MPDTVEIVVNWTDESYTLVECVSIAPKCPRCASDDTGRERNYGRTIKDDHWWRMKCSYLWFVDNEPGQHAPRTLR
jgi:hypothetical protein